LIFPLKASTDCHSEQREESAFFQRDGKSGFLAAPLLGRTTYFQLADYLGHVIPNNAWLAAPPQPRGMLILVREEKAG
jgi:hypothetical protein